MRSTQSSASRSICTLLAGSRRATASPTLAVPSSRVAPASPASFRSSPESSSLHSIGKWARKVRARRLDDLDRRCEGRASVALVVDERSVFEVLCPDADDERPGAAPGLPKRGAPFLGELRFEKREADRVALDPCGHEAHGRRAHEARDEEVHRLVVELLRRADLLDDSQSHHRTRSPSVIASVWSCVTYTVVVPACSGAAPPRRASPRAASHPGSREARP